LIRVKLE